MKRKRKLSEARATKILREMDKRDLKDIERWVDDSAERELLEAARKQRSQRSEGT